MGCQVSNTVRPAKATSEAFTPEQKILLRKTWRIMSSDLMEMGCRIFSTIFEQNPHVRDYFPFGDLFGKELVKNLEFRAHASRFMNSLGAIMENIDNYEKDLSPLLVTLGRNHVRIPSFNPNYFSAFEEAILHVWTEDLGEKFTPECKKAWECVLRFIHLTLKSGYFQAMNENIREDQKTVYQG